MSKYLILLTLIIAVTSVKSGGGWSTVEANEEIKEIVVKALQLTTQGINKELDHIFEQELTFYGSQIVAGINHGVVFKNSENGLFTCLKIWEKLDQTFELTNQGVSANLKELEHVCGIPGLAN